MASLILCLALAQVASASLTFVKGGTSPICFGADLQCATAEACSTSYYSYCSSTVSTASSAYIKQSVVGVYEITGADGAYLTSSNLMTSFPTAPASSVSTQMPNGHIGVNLAATTSAGISPYIEFAHVETANWYAGNSTAVALKGYWVSVAFMLLKNITPSTASLSGNKVNVAYCNTPTCTFASGWGGGCVDGEACGHDVCLSTTASNTCGANMTYTPGDIKYSMFGMVDGSSVSTASTVNYVAIRTKWELVNYPANHELLFNGGTLANIGTTDVTGISVKNAPGGAETVSVTFQTKYNYGSNGDTSYNATMAPAGAKNVKIKASGGASSTQFYVDYVFDAVDLKQAGAWWLYDPKVTATASGTPGSGLTSGARQVVNGLIAVLFTMAASVF